MDKPNIWYVNIFVSDLERALEFYRDRLGLPVTMMQDPDGNIFYLDQFREH